MGRCARRQVAWLACLTRADYLKQTFVATDPALAHYRPLLRIVPARIFLATFSSDRSHMLDMQGKYIKPVPPWPAICGPQATGPNTLWSHWLKVDEDWNES